MKASRLYQGCCRMRQYAFNACHPETGERGSGRAVHDFNAQLVQMILDRLVTLDQCCPDRVRRLHWMSAVPVTGAHIETQQKNSCRAGKHGNIDRLKAGMLSSLHAIRIRRESQVPVVAKVVNVVLEIRPQSFNRTFLPSE